MLRKLFRPDRRRISWKPRRPQPSLLSGKGDMDFAMGRTAGRNKGFSGQEVLRLARVAYLRTFRLSLTLRRQRFRLSTCGANLLSHIEYASRLENSSAASLCEWQPIADRMSRQTGTQDPSERARKINGLHADRPSPGLEDKLALFGQFVGDWDILENRYLQPDGTWSVSRGELHWGWILDGRAVQDVWMSIDEKTHRPVPEGTTVRFYDPKIDAWHSVWISPTQNVVKTFLARQIGAEIVLEGKTAKGYPVKWIFSEITHDSFRWHSEESHDNGKTWMLKEEMQIRRR